MDDPGYFSRSHRSHEVNTTAKYVVVSILKRKPRLPSKKRNGRGHKMRCGRDRKEKNNDAGSESNQLTFDCHKISGCYIYESPRLLWVFNKKSVRYFRPGLIFFLRNGLSILCYRDSYYNKPMKIEDVHSSSPTLHHVIRLEKTNGESRYQPKIHNVRGPEAVKNLFNGIVCLCTLSVCYTQRFEIRNRVNGAAMAE